MSEERGKVSPPEGYPVRHTFTIWVEGYVTPREQGVAEYVGTVESTDFRTACVAWATYHRDFAKHYNREKNTYRGCRLFPTEAEARKAHG